MPQIQKLEKWLEEFANNYREYRKNGGEQDSANFVVISDYQQKDGLFPLETVGRADNLTTYHYHANKFWSRKDYCETKNRYFIDEGVDDSLIEEVGKAIKKEVDAGFYEVSGLAACGYPILEKITDEKELPYIKGLVVEI